MTSSKQYRPSGDHSARPTVCPLVLLVTPPSPSLQPSPLGRGGNHFRCGASPSAPGFSIIDREFTLPMTLKVGRVAPRAPSLMNGEDGAHGVTRPTAVIGFKGARRVIGRGNLSLRERVGMRIPQTQTSCFEARGLNVGRADLQVRPTNVESMGRGNHAHSRLEARISRDSSERSQRRGRAGGFPR